jgi:ribosomal protein L40E
MGAFFFWYIVIGLVVGTFSGNLASKKGYSFLFWFFGGLFFGIVALIAAAGLPLRRDMDQAGASNDAPVRKTCPKCAERIMVEAKVCRHCGNKFNEAQILEALRDAVIEDPRAGARVLGLLGTRWNEKVIPVLEAIAAHGLYGERLEATNALLEFDTPEALTLAFTKGAPSLRKEAAGRLAEMGDKSCVPALFGMFQTSSLASKLATELIWKLGDAADRKMLLEVLSGEETPFKSGIVWGLGGAGAAEAVPALVELLGSPELRVQTKDALIQIGAPALSILRKEEPLAKGAKAMAIHDAIRAIEKKTGG